MDTTKTTAFLTGVAAGAGIMYLFHPDCGRSRRNRLADQAHDKAVSSANTVVAQVNDSLDHVQNKVTGSVAEALPDEKPENDQTLIAKVRSEVLGGRWGAYTINVDASDGVVTLRGQVDRDEQVSELEEDVAGVTGVEEVRNFLHIPGVPAPNAPSTPASS
jgi:osmotically-inducible protein OsmY